MTKKLIGKKGLELILSRKDCKQLGLGPETGKEFAIIYVRGRLGLEAK